jgi:hypothetical protein
MVEEIFHFAQGKEEGIFRKLGGDLVPSRGSV